tara:strand:- start:5886 stop:7565 length:1680 start_codon:yes stop_codon:yes gene_type:complete
MSDLKDLIIDSIYTLGVLDEESQKDKENEAREILAEEGPYWRQEAFNRFDRDSAIYEEDIKAYRTRENKIKSLTSNYGGDVDTLASELASLDGYDLSTIESPSTRNNILNNYKANFVGYDADNNKVDDINNAVRVEFTDTLPEPIEPMLSSYYDSNIMAKAIDNLDIRGSITNKLKGRTDNTREILNTMQQEFAEKRSQKTSDYKNFFKDPEVRSVNVNPIESKALVSVTEEELEKKANFFKLSGFKGAYDKWQETFQGITNMKSDDYNTYARLLQNILQLSTDEVDKLFVTDTIKGTKVRKGLTLEGQEFFNSIAPILDEVYKKADIAFTKNANYDTYQLFIDRDYVLNLTEQIGKFRAIDFKAKDYKAIFGSEKLRVYMIPESIVSTEDLITLAQDQKLDEFKSAVKEKTMEEFETLQTWQGVSDDEKKLFINNTFPLIVQSTINTFLKTTTEETVGTGEEVINQPITIAPMIQDGKLIGGDLPSQDGKPGSIDLESLKDSSNLEELKNNYPQAYEYYINNINIEKKLNTDNITGFNTGGLLDEQDFLNNFRTNFSD